MLSIRAGASRSALEGSIGAIRAAATSIHAAFRCKRLLLRLSDDFSHEAGEEIVRRFCVLLVRAAVEQRRDPVHHCDVSVELQ